LVMRPRNLTYTLLLCVALGRLAAADVMITAPEARTAIAKLDSLDHLRSGAKNDSARVANLVDQVRIQEMRNLEQGDVLTKLTFQRDKADEQIVHIGRQKNAWRTVAYTSTAIALVLGGLMYLTARR